MVGQDIPGNKQDGAVLGASRFLILVLCSPLPVLYGHRDRLTAWALHGAIPTTSPTCPPVDFVDLSATLKPRFLSSFSTTTRCLPMRLIAADLDLTAGCRSCRVGGAPLGTRRAAGRLGRDGLGAARRGRPPGFGPVVAGRLARRPRR